MKLYNTRTQQIEPFQPARENITLYTCGITPYDTTHLGHAFTYCAVDGLIRYLEMRGYHVTYVQNVTDIDDDILKKAAEVGKNWHVLGNQWTRHFIHDMQSLNVRPPDQFPRATEVIPQILEMVQALLGLGIAYESGGNVYFHVDAWPAYGRFSRIPRQEMLPIANERGNHPDDPHKQDPLDFVLWQRQKPGEPAWPSLWGDGRPGWHIECSAMATHFLGETIDIHGGGMDLRFPHHESEIAQVEAITGRVPFVRFWLHVGMVEYEGQKMSKSLGNLVMVNNLLQRYPPDAIRIYLGMHHYRHPWSYDEEKLQQAAHMAEKLKTAVTVTGSGDQPLDTISTQAAFIQAMDNDLDTAGALASIREAADEILLRADGGYDVTPAQGALRQMAGVFGLRLDAETAETHVLAGWNKHLEKFM